MSLARLATPVRGLFADPTACLLMLILAITGAWIAAELRHDFHLLYALDSFDYKLLSETNPPADAVFGARRPPGYPLLLDVARTFGATYRALPYIQYAIFSAAILVLFWCCLLGGFKPWEALLLTVPLASASLLREYGSYMLTEVPSTALAIVAVGLAYLIASRGPGRTRNASLSLTVVLACLIRPSWLFLVPLLPFAILIITPSVRPFARTRRILRELAINFGSTALPVLVYAVIRFAFIGHFGIVSYGGVALSGFGTSPALLTRSDLGSLSTPEVRGLANAILERRDSLAKQRPNNVPAFAFDEVEIAKHPMMEAWPEAFDVSIWKVAVPAAREFYNASRVNELNPDWVLINDRLGALSSEVIAKQNGTYFTWLVTAGRSALQNVFHYETAGRFSVGAAVMLLIVIVAARTVAGSIKAVARPVDLRPAYVLTAVAFALVLAFNAEGFLSLVRTVVAVAKGTIIGSLYPLTVMFYCLAAAGLFWLRHLTGRSRTPPAIHPTVAYGALVVLFFLAGTILIVLVEIPGKRYLTSLSPLMPGVVLLFSTKLILRLLATLTHSQAATLKHRG